VLKYGRDEDFFKKHSPCTLRPQGREIIRTWLYYTLLKDYLLTGECIFDDVWINYYVIDETGKKMSKSIGNIVDPKDILDRYGAEPFRLWSALEGNIVSSDFRFSYERIEGAGKTISKLWNVSRFVTMFPRLSHEEESEAKEHLTILDKWILNELNMLIIEANQGYANYDIHNPSVKIRHFIWETFASHYLEMVKNRAYNQNNEYTKPQQHAAIYAIYTVLDNIMKLWAPVLPFMTYHIYKTLHEGRDIHFEAFPKALKEYDVDITKEEIIELNSYIWKSKKDAGKSLKDEIKKLVIEEKYAGIQHDIISAHNIKDLKFGERAIEL
jgi:valyl-tRNA synthetase